MTGPYSPQQKPIWERRREEEERKRLEMQQLSTPADTLSNRVGGAVPMEPQSELDASLAPDTMKPTETESTEGLKPSSAAGTPATPSGGVDNTVAQTEAEVNKILGRGKPSAGRLRDAVSAYEAAASNLREQSVDTTALDQSLADVRSAYREKVKRNEMLGLVQLVAQSFAKLAAYQYGAGKGRYIADQVSVPGVDYEKRTDRALDERKLEEGDIRDQRKIELDRADKRYQMEKDRAQSLRERIGAEERALSTEASTYASELAAARAADAAAKAEGRAVARETSSEERFNRQYGAKEYDNAQQEESLLARVTASLQDPKKAGKLNVDALATQANIAPDELVAIKEQAATEAEAEDTIFTDQDRIEKEKVQAALLQVIRNKAVALAERKRIANEMMSTGISREQARAQRPEEASIKAPPPGKIIKSKVDGATRPYDEKLWQQIQSSPKRDQYEIISG